MSSRTTTTAALVAAATALAGGAYALGSQSDGSAEAAKATAAATPAPFGRRGWHDRGGPGAGLSDLASRLGVPEAKLRVALQDLRGTDPGDLGARQASLISSIASSLKVSEAEVKAAFNAVRKQGQGGPRGLRSGPDELAATLAKQLGVSQAKVRTALDTAFQAQRESHVDEIAGTLATALKVDKAKVAAALAALRPAPGSGPRDHPPGDGGIAAALARKLGVPVADVRAALQKLRTQRELQMSAARDAFAVKLADKLGISAAKVKSALNDHGPFGLHDGPGGRGGHGGGFFRHP